MEIEKGKVSYSVTNEMNYSITNEMRGK